MTCRIHSPIAGLVAVTLAVMLQDGAKAQSSVAAHTIADREHVTIMTVDGAYDPQPQNRPGEIAIRQAVAKEFLRTHEDDYDFLVVFTQFPFSFGSDGEGVDLNGRYYGVKNDVDGIGLPRFDGSSTWGSAGRFQGYIDMGSLPDVGKDPTDSRFEGTLSTLAHEVGHRWLSHARFRDRDGAVSDALLGRDGAHWSFLLNSSNSVMYGNEWRANGDGTFSAIGRPRTFFSPLDLYLMGLQPAAAVPPFVLIDSDDRRADELPEAGVTVAGTARTISIDDVIAAEGARVPSVENAPKRFKLGFVLLVRPGHDAEDFELAGINTIRDAFTTRMIVLTNGKAIVDAAPAARPDEVAPPPPVLPPSSGPRTTPVDLAQAVSWLAVRQQADGGWSDSRWTTARDTAAVLELFATIPSAVVARDRGRAWFTANGASANVDTAARRILSLGSPSVAVDIEFLRASANSSGGWGLGRGYQSDPLDTALALTTGASADAAKHLAYLVQTQNADGGWGLRAGGPSSLTSTISVLSALRTYEGSSLSSATERATVWLYGRQRANGGFGDETSAPGDTARAVLYLAGASVAGSQLGLAVDYLKSAQLQDGSWGESVYDTALAVRALRVAELPNATVVAGSVTAAPSSPVEGQIVTVTAEIANAGSTLLPPVTVRFSDGEAAGGNLIAEATTGPLDAFARTRVSIVWDTHDRAGNHVLHLVVDPDDAIPESNEVDNGASRGLTVRAADAGVDLSISTQDIALSPDRLVSVPQAQSLVAHVSNLGRTNAQHVTVSLFDGNPEASASRIADRLAEVPGGGSTTVAFSFDVRTSGDHEYVVVLDPANTLNDPDRSNNRASAVLQASAGVDLAVLPESPTFSENPIGVGRDVTISAIVANYGTSAAFSVPVQFSIDDPLGRLALGSRVVDLQPGETRPISVVWRAARAMANAPVVVEIDPGDAFGDSSRANNRRTAPLTVTSSTLPNLRVSAGDLQVSSPIDAGGRATMSLVVHNDGNSTTENVPVRFFAGDPSSGGTQISVAQSISRIDAGSAATAQVVWEPVVSAAQAIVFGVVDRDNAIAEYAEDDNSTFVTVAVRSLPDLAVGAASIRFTPAFPRQNEAVTIAATALNSGEQIARGAILRFFNGNPAAGGTQIGVDRPIGDIAAGMQGSGEVVLESVSAGVHDIYVQIDPDGRVAEQRKDNNIAFRRLGIQDASLWVTNPYFSPNGDGVQDTTELFFRLGDQRVVASIDVERRQGEIVRTFALSSASGAGDILWDGRRADGRIVADGEYLFRLRGPASNDLGSAVVVVDNNASPITDAIGTEFFLNTNLTCKVAGPAGPFGNGTFTDYRNNLGYGVNAGWLADDSGFVQWIQTQAPCAGGVTCQPTFTNSQVGVYVTPPSGDTPRRITPDAWTLVPPVTNGTDILDTSLAPGGQWIGMTVARYTLISGAKRFVNPIEYWVVKPDGSNLTLVGTSEEEIGSQFSPTFYPVVFSPGGDRLLFVRNRRDPAVANRLVDSTLVNVNVADGTQTPVKTYPGSSAGAYGSPISGYYEWAPGGRHIVVHVLQVDSANDPQQRAVSQYHALDPDGHGNRLLFAGEPSGVKGLYLLGPDRVAVIGERGPDGNFVGFSQSRGFDTPLWLFALSGGAPVLAAPDVESTFATVSPDRRYLAFSDSQLQRADGSFDPHATGIWIVDSTGRTEQVYVADEKNQGLYPSVGGSARGWSADGRLVAFEPRLPFDSNDALIDAVVVDTELRSGHVVQVNRVSSNSDHVRAFFPDDRTLLTGYPYGAVDIETATRSELPLDPQANIFGSSSSGNYLLYQSGRDSSTPATACWVGYPRDDVWTLTSMLNLSAALAFERDGGQLLLRGTAQDLNFLQYSLEFASVQSPETWSPIDQPSDRAVSNGVLARWIPPSEGSFLVRLTVADRAGNTTSVHKRVTWGALPAITNLSSSPKVFSPDGDGEADALTLNYTVLAPIALQFDVFNPSNHLVRTIRQDHASIGPASIAWDGRDDAGGFVENGVYRVHVRDYDLYITVDTKAPNVAVSIGSGLHVVVPTGCAPIAAGSLNTLVNCRSGSPTIAQPYWTITGHVDDENLVSRRLETGAGVNPSEWVLLDDGATRQGALGPDGAIKTPVEDTDLRTLRSVADVYGRRVRLTATDRAGNRAARVSDFAPEEIIAFAWDARPIAVNAATEQKPGAHVLSIQHTVRRPIDAFTIQYRVENTSSWINGPSSSVGSLTMDLPWDTTPLVVGRTYEVRVAATDGTAVVQASNVFSIHSNRFELTRIEDSMVFGIESLREPLTEIRLVLAASGDMDLGTGVVERFEPPTFGVRINGPRVSELCRTGWSPVPTRFKGIGQSGAVYYTDVKSITCRNEWTPEGGALKLTVARLFAQSCGQANPEQVVITAGVVDTGGLVSGSETLSIQEVPNGPLKPLEGVRFPVNMTLSTATRPEGSYVVRATARVLMAGASQALEEREVATTATFIVDRQPPSSLITYPITAQSFCPVPRNGRVVVPTEGTAIDANFDSYEIEFGAGGVPTSWSSIPPASVSTGTSRQLPVQNGLLADWDVTGLTSGVYSLRLRVRDRGGNVSCQQVPVDLSAGVEIGTLSVNRRLFSPNGDGLLDDVTVSYSLGQAAVVSARVFALQNEQPDTGAVRTLLASAQQLAGAQTVLWNGFDDSGVRVPDGDYVVVIGGSDGCGTVSERRIRLTVDATRPEAILDAPALASLGLLADLRGTAADANFKEYRLDVGTGEAPSTWSLLASGSMPIQDGLLGKWRTPAAGVFTLRLTASDEAANSREARATITLAERPGLLTLVDVDPFIFSPNGDNRLDVAAIHYALGVNASVVVEIADQSGVVVTLANAGGVASSRYTVLWDGRSTSGAVVPDGDYLVRIKATADSDSSSTQIEQTTVRVDTRTPEIAIDTPGDGMQLAGDTLEVRGTATDTNLEHYEVSYTHDGAAPVTLAAEPRSRSHALLASILDLADGSYSATITAVDRAQNRRSVTHSFVVDRAAPVVSILAPENGGIAGGSQAMLEIRGAIAAQHLKDWVLRYAATGIDPPQWSTIAGGATVSTSEVLGVWPVGAIPDGTYTLSLVATNQAGAMGEARVTIAIDNTPPVAALTSSPSGLLITGPTPIVGTASDAHFSTARLELAAGDAQSAFEYIPLATLTEPVADSLLFALRSLPRDGTYTLRLTVNDRAGLRVTATTPLTVAAHPPQPPTTLVGTREDRDTIRLTWQPSTEPADRLLGYHVYRGGQRVTTIPVAAASFTDLHLTDGVQRYSVTAVSLAGIESTPSNEALVSIDLTPPLTALHAPLSAAFVSGLIDIRGTAAAVDFKEYRVFAGTGPGALTSIRRSPAPVTAGVLAQYDTSALGHGATLVIRLEAEDLLGNVGVHEVSVTIDDVAPAAPTLIDALVNGSTVNLQWQGGAADLAGYLLYDNAVLANADRIVTNVTPYLLSGTSYSDGAVPDGAHAYYVVAVDRAGNTSLPSNIRTVDIETRTPRATIIRPASGTRTDASIELFATTADLDVNRVQFQFKASTAIQWSLLGSPIVSAPFAVTWNPSGLPRGIYQFRAVATDVRGNTDGSPPVVSISYQEVLAPGAPSGVSARVDSGTALLTWTAPADSDLKGYFVYRTSEDGIDVRVSGLLTTASFSDTDRPDGHYTYSVTAVDTSDNESTRSVVARAHVYTPIIVAPASCVAEAATGLSGRGATPGSTVTVFVSLGQSAISSAATTAASDGAFAFTTLPLSAGANAVWVQALDGNGNTSKPSAVASVSYQPVGPVDGLTAVATGSDVVLNWSGPSGPATRFNVYRGETRLLARVAGTTFFDRAPSGPHTYYIAAVNACGAAGPRAAASVNVQGSQPAPPSLGYPTAPNRQRAVSATTTPVSGTAEPGTIVTVLQNGSVLGSASALADPRLDDFVLPGEPDTDVTIFAGHSSIATFARRPGEREPVLFVTDAVTRNTRYYDQITSDDPPAFSNHAEVMAVVAYVDDAYRLVIVDRRTGSISRLDLPGWSQHLAFSADGTRIAYVFNGDVWMSAVSTGAAVAVTSGASAAYPVWSPDGGRIAYVDQSDGARLRLIDPVTHAAVDVDVNASGAPVSFTPDGKTIAFSSSRGGREDIWLYDVASGVVTPVPAGLSGAARRSNATFAADGSALAYLRQADDFFEYAIVIRNLVSGVVDEIATGDFRTAPFSWLGDGSLVQVDGSRVRRYRPSGHFQVDDVVLNQGTNVLAAVAQDAAHIESGPSEPIVLTREMAGLPDVQIASDALLVYPPFAAPGAPVWISATVSNTGDEPAHDVSVTFVESASDSVPQTIHSRTISVIDAGSEASVTLEWKAPVVTGRHTIRAIVDPLNAIDELDETNNSVAGGVIIATGSDPMVRAATDRESYPPSATVAVSAEVLNPGGPADFTMHIRIEDESGHEVTTLDHQVLTAFGFDSRAFATTWSPAEILAGRYRVHASLTKADGTVFESVAAFAIETEERLAASVTTDRASYSVDQPVVVTARVRNDSLNADIAGLTASIRIVNDAGVEMARTDTALGILLRGSQAQVQSRWVASGTGTFAARLIVYSDSAGQEQQASATVAFAVEGVANVTGLVTVSPGLVRLGQPVALTATVRNTGTAAATNVPLRLLVVDPDRQAVIKTHERILDLVPGAEAGWTVDETTAGLSAKAYAVLLQRIAPTEQALSTAALLIVDGTAPVLHVVSPAASTYHRSDVVVEVLASDDVSGIDRLEFSIDGGAPALVPVQDAAAGRYGFLYTASSMTEGRRVLTVRAFDKAGNGPGTSSSDPNPVSTEFVVDLTPPAIEVAGVVDGGRYETAPAPAVAITDFTAVTSVITLDGAPFITGTAVNADGEHVLDVRATDQAGNETTRVVRFTVDANPANRTPTANAGPNQNVAVGTAVTLDGSASEDVDGDLITYAWRILSVPANSALTQSSLTNASRPNASLVPDVSGTFTVELVVNDGHVNSAPDTVDVVAYVANVRPNADAGRDQQGIFGTRVTVDGSQSGDADSGPQPLSYAWHVLEVPAGSQTTTASVENRFTAIASFSPDVAGEFVLELIVSDGEAEARDQVRIVSTANTQPIADAGADIVVALGTTVMVDGSGSRDDDGGPEPLSYMWAFVSVPAGSAVGNGSLSGGSTMVASFIPDVGGVYVLALTVSDGVSTDSDNVAVTIRSTTGRAHGGAYFYQSGYQEKLSLDVTITANTVAASSWLKYFYTRTRTNLESTRIDSIALDGRTATVSGVAKMNGMPGYRFVAIVSDGSPDAFSIRIVKPDGSLFYEYGSPCQGGDLVVLNDSR